MGFSALGPCAFCSVADPDVLLLDVLNEVHGVSFTVLGLPGSTSVNMAFHLGGRPLASPPLEGIHERPNENRRFVAFFAEENSGMDGGDGYWSKGLTNAPGPIF
jgi:hypothetical protein